MCSALLISLSCPVSFPVLEISFNSRTNEKQNCKKNEGWLTSRRKKLPIKLAVNSNYLPKTIK